MGKSQKPSAELKKPDTKDAYCMISSWVVVGIYLSRAQANYSSNGKIPYLGRGGGYKVIQVYWNSRMSAFYYAT